MYTFNENFLLFLTNQPTNQPKWMGFGLFKCSERTYRLEKAWIFIFLLIPESCRFVWFTSYDLAGVVNEDDNETGDDQETFVDHQLPSKHIDEIPKTKLSTAVKTESLLDDFPSCILKCKSVFKCKICPRIVCLNEDTMRAHLKSKVRHMTWLFFSNDCPSWQAYLYYQAFHLCKDIKSQYPI